ncbi:MAG TPA: MFS transporter [Terracidiphilus sp.]|nr:MFS transporter [Terracidiphilus sp.]
MSETRVNPNLPGDTEAPTSSSVDTDKGQAALNRAIARARMRLVPFLMLMYVVSFLDRSNIGFAKEPLQTYVGISPESYALAAGLFFISYSFCGFPSNLLLHRIGAKIWMTVIMVAWGAVSMATMFVKGDTSLYTLRLLLGITEAGFFPGVILYLTYWFPSRVRGQIMGLFYIGVPIALLFGSPLSGLLLELHEVGGLQGWQWMFLIEGAIAIFVGIAAFWYLDDKPAQAKWMPDDERRILINVLAAEESDRRSSSPGKLLKMVRDRRVLHFLAIYTLIQISVYGVVFYLPTEVGALIHQSAGLEVGVVSAIPWVIALVVVWWLPLKADRSQSHRNLAAAAMFLGGCASFVFPTAGPAVGIIALSVGISTFIAVQPLFWTFPTGYLADRAAAGGIAVITLGNLGGFVAPNVKVWADEHFHSAHAGLYLLAGLTVLNAVLILAVRNRRTAADPGGNTSLDQIESRQGA